MASYPALQNAQPSSSSSSIWEDISYPDQSEGDPFCDICMDRKPDGEMFRNSNASTCAHSFCKDCISSYIAVKIQENTTVVKCPHVNCQVIIRPELCHSFLPKQVLERWEIALCECLILDSQKFYCPYKDCSALLVDDGGEAVTASECPICNRLFCAQCKVSWHSGMDCDEFQSLTTDEREREDILLIQLAKEKQWKRCPRCRFYVEKKEGCLYILCRCGFEFCYGCGSNAHSSHDCPHNQGA